MEIIKLLSNKATKSTNGMEGAKLKKSVSRYQIAWLAATLLAALLLASSFAMAGHPAQKNKKDTSEPAPPMPAIAGSDSQQIDHDIGEMLGAFQVGDVEAMHKYYADNATFVSGSYAPPLAGMAELR